MRKLFLCLIFVIVGLSAFSAAQREKKPMDLSFGGNYTFLSETGNLLGSDVTANYDSLGIHFEMGGMIDQQWGVVNNIGAYFPFKITSEMNGVRSTVDMSVYNMMAGMHIALGFPYYFVQKAPIHFGIGPATDFLSLMSGTSSLTGIGFYGGLGLVADGKVMFSDSGFLNFGIYGIYNFFQYSTYITAYGSSSNSGFTNSIVIKPYIGIGFTVNQ